MMSLVWSVVFWGAAEPFRSVSYTDSLFLCMSAMTGAGLNTINLSTLTSFQQAMLFALILLGSPILISSTVLFVRKRAFESKFKGIVEEHVARNSSTHGHQHSLNLPLTRLRRKSHSVTTKRDVEDAPGGAVASGSQSAPFEIQRSTRDGAENTQSSPTSLPHDVDQIRSLDDDQLTLSVSFRERARHHRVFPMAGVGAHPDLHHPKDAVPNLMVDNRRPSLIKSAIKGTQKYFSSKGFISRNSQFVGLTPAEREKLGGVEYKAISFLSVIVPLYFILFNILGIIGCGSWLAVNRPSVARVNGLAPFWTGAFFAVSAFGNNGMSLLDQNMTVLQTSSYMLITMGMLILAGNTLYPCFLRFIIWTMRCLLPKGQSWQEWKTVLDFILDHPRRVYTHLFPAHHTWYLLGTIIILNGIDWLGFEILSIGNKSLESLGSYRVLDGLFQALAVRSGGFYVVTIADLKQGLLVLYVLMMDDQYVSAYPVLVTIRNTNVYEERSLGIYANDNLADDQRRHASLGSIFDHIKVLLFHSSKTPADNGGPVLGFDENNPSRSYFVRQQLRSQLSHDIWWICLAILVITIAESSNYERDPVAFSTFNIIFEVVSAYGCVGISVGLPDQNYSFSGGWHTISKLVLVAVMLRGRHRGLPVAIDKAVMLPDEALAWAEEEDAALRLERSMTRAAAVRS
ncbi:Potassium transporter, partial [Rasamsonia emersonii CBS 393.64]